MSTSQATTKRKSPSEVFTDQLKLFLPAFAPHNEWVDGEKPIVTELRVLGIPGWKQDVKPSDRCGFFNLGSAEGRQALHNAVKSYVVKPADQQPEGIYLMMNPVEPVFLARAKNRMGPKGKAISAADEHILRRRWLVVDADPKRPISGVSATDEEKNAARLVIDGVRDDLRRRGWSEPMVCDSGNGFHLWYRIDLPRDDGGLVEHTLKQMARHHNSAGATVDTGTFNPSRIMKLPGTWARKGSATADRPHRPARILEVPEPGEPTCAL